MLDDSMIKLAKIGKRKKKTQQYKINKIKWKGRHKIKYTGYFIICKQDFSFKRLKLSSWVKNKFNLCIYYLQENKIKAIKAENEEVEKEIPSKCKLKESVCGGAILMKVNIFKLKKALHSIKQDIYHDKMIISEGVIVINLYLLSYRV